MQCVYLQTSVCMCVRVLQLCKLINPLSAPSSGGSWDLQQHLRRERYTWFYSAAAERVSHVFSIRSQRAGGRRICGRVDVSRSNSDGIVSPVSSRPRVFAQWMELNLLMTLMKVRDEMVVVTKPNFIFPSVVLEIRLQSDVPAGPEELN